MSTHHTTAMSSSSGGKNHNHYFKKRENTASFLGCRALGKGQCHQKVHRHPPRPATALPVPAHTIQGSATNSCLPPRAGTTCLAKGSLTHQLLPPSQPCAAENAQARQQAGNACPCFRAYINTVIMAAAHQPRFSQSSVTPWRCLLTKALPTWLYG